MDPSRRDAPDLLAIDRVALGWLPRDAVRVAPASTETTTLAPSTGATGATGTRLVVIPIDEHRFVTVELLTSDGFDDHLDGAGVVVHMIDDSPEQCGATTRCTGPDRVQQIVAADGSEHTLLSAGDRITVDQWNIDVDQISADGDAITAQVTVGRAAPAQE
ncbi:MAG: hypothetical protein JWN99_2950 [Ilumatobacteraceae bacterium]|nr:hypothetical protein [Ilumatobacteraceae bacterium]